MRRRFCMTPTAQVLVLFAVLWNTETCPGQTAADPHAAPLSSWNEGPAKQAILAFVARITTEGSPDFVPAKRADRHLR